MPEGDTIYRAARTLASALGGKVIRAARARDERLADRVEALAGRSVTAVESRGKNLLIHFDDSSVLYTHMRMTGSWHLYRHGEAWRKPPERARIVLEFDAIVAVCFSAPVVELMTERAAAHHPALARLGPDLLADRVDLGEIARRIAARGELAVGEAIMNQSLVSGIGNVYKSETLFVCGVDPFARVAELGESTIRRIVRTARELMLRNLDGNPRRTRFAPGRARHWVYGRSGRPCRRCGRSIEMRRQSTAGRSTYFCPHCQRRSAPSAAGEGG